MAMDGVTFKEWELIAKECYETAASLPAKDIPQVIFALTKAQKRSFPVMQRLKEEIMERLPQFSVAELCFTVGKRLDRPQILSPLLGQNLILH